MEGGGRPAVRGLRTWPVIGSHSLMGDWRKILEGLNVARCSYKREDLTDAAPARGGRAAQQLAEAAERLCEVSSFLNAAAATTTTTAASQHHHRCKRQTICLRDKGTHEASCLQ